ncbi:MAG: YggS family pyridoxal phosphate-dependent enzyme [Candidatus Binataceae bacterium]
MLVWKEISARLDRVRERIAQAQARTGRPPGSVRLVLASKTQPSTAIAAACAAGAREFGENYVQEAVEKRPGLAAYADIRWHLIGHLQSNKARLAAVNFDLIQTLDSERLATTLNRIRPSIPVLLEVKLGDEPGKNGVAPGEVERLIEKTRELVKIQGLMTIPPLTVDSERARPYFAQLRDLRDRLASISGLELRELSMGMTEDFEIAIEEGATIVRVGRAVFGERQAQSS